MSIEFGNIKITRERNEWKAGAGEIATLPCYEITIDDGEEKPLKNICYCDNIDKVILAALQLKYEGHNGSFTEYAAKILEINAPLWG